MHCNIDPTIITKTISNTELYLGDIYTAQTFYTEELSWDALQYIRAVSFEFQTPEQDAIAKWFNELIKEIPAYLYYLSEECFNYCIKLILKYEHPNLLNGDYPTRDLILESITQVAVHEGELLPLVDHVCNQILNFPTEESTDAKNFKTLISDYPSTSNVIWLHRIRRKSHR